MVKQFIRVVTSLAAVVLPLVAGAVAQQAETAAGPAAPQSAHAELVVVAGATGRTGTEVVNELLMNGYRVRAFVRDIDKARAKLGEGIEYAGGDVRQPATIADALEGADALISAIGAGRGDPTNGPEFVDYGGVKNLADASAAAGLRQMVLVSSMGVTQEDHILNKMFDDVLNWKFKGEEALRTSGVPYTIVRPGGLTNAPGGEFEIIFRQGDKDAGVIPRADVARVCVAALGSANALNKTFEVTGGKTPPAAETTDGFAALLADSPANSNGTANDAE
ncbi:MAG: SDR family oxidoreductase [Gammaproteobacteria bacterium]